MTRKGSDQGAEYLPADRHAPTTNSRLMREHSMQQTTIVATNAPEALIRRYYLEFANHYTDNGAASAIADVLTEDFVFHPPNNTDGYVGRDRHRQWLIWHHAVLTEQRFQIEDVVLGAEKAATRWTLTGIHAGEFLGIAPTHRRVTVWGLDFFRLSETRIAELWRSFDLREVARQFTAEAVQPS
jgi:predicted ester cyclase